MTIESPRGLKNNLKQNFGPGGFVNANIYDTDDYGAHWKRLLFSLGFIHALIHERKKFGPLGWNLPYEFNSSDFEVAVLQLQSLLADNAQNIPFGDLKYITGEVIYGGRVTDDYDRRCLLSLLSNFFCPQAIAEEHYYGEGSTYAAPEKHLSYAGVLEFIEELPDEDDPSIFGMNVYAQKMLLGSQGDQLIGAILSMEPVKHSKTIGDSTRIE
jgi:dynein heavy chain